MKSTSLKLCAAIAALTAAAAVAAHHSFAAEFDREKPITLTGTVAKLEWTNPHARIYVDVADDSGNVVHWDFELGPPNGLMRQGWNRNSLRQGNVVTIEGFLSKNAPQIGSARTVTLADGRRVFAGSALEFKPVTPESAPAR